MRKPRNIDAKNMNIQKPVWDVPGRRSAAPTIIAPVQQAVRKRHWSGSCHQSIANRRHDGRRKVLCLAPRIEYHTVYGAKKIVPSSTTVQNTASGFAWLSNCGSISAYPIPTDSPIATTLRAAPQKSFIDLTRPSSATAG